MELLYLWIYGHNNIFKQGFKFSNKYNICFNYDDKILNISKSESDHLNLFDNSFLNVTAIIGKNGSGKTSLFSFFKNIFSDSMFHFKRYLLVLKDSKNEILIIDTFSAQNENIILKSNLENEVRIKVEKDNKIIHKNIDLIIHSNSFSNYEFTTQFSRYYDTSFNNFIDICSRRSNENLLKRYDHIKGAYDCNNLENDDYKRELNLLVDRSLPRIYVHIENIKSIFKLIVKHKSSNWNFIPERIDISFNDDFINKYYDFFKEVGLEKVINDIHYFVFMKFPENNNLLSEKLTVYFFLYYVFAEKFYGPKNSRINDFINKLSKEGNTENISVLIKEFFENSEMDSSIDLTHKIKSFIHFMEASFSTTDRNFWYSSHTYSFLFNDNFSNFLNSLFEIWKDFDFVFGFSWQGLSAGEEALLNIFSRLNSLLDRGFIFRDTIWVLIDEGDLYLHPEWQRTFFSDLHEYLPKIFENKKIQLFLTSHSPILVSDLPKENIILLDKVDWICKVLEKEVFSKTFGANIHTLYSEPFFLHGGLMGEFAKSKIEDLVKYLKNDPDNQPKEEWDDEKAKGVIGIVGEPILKDFLNDLYNTRFANEKTIQKLENEIAELKKKLNQ